MRQAGRTGLDLFVIAGEESGDRLGAPLMAAITAQARRPVSFSGVGGRAMAEQGLESLVPITDLAINGFAAIPARLPTILRHLRTTSRAVVAARPDALVIIDSPDFTHRVARRVRATAPSIPIIDYVSPTVWAWRPGRAKAMRRYVDHVLALLPFEPAVHRRLGGPPCTYVGHPLIEQLATLRPGPDDAARRAAIPPLVLVLPGSRRGEVRRHIGVFAAAIAIAAREVGDIEIVLPTVPHLLDEVRQSTREWATPPRIVVDSTEKWAAFRRARAALAASGTVTLELALAGVPTVLAYRVALFEEAIARALITTQMIGLANLILGEKVMPELLQRDATPENLAAHLVALIRDTPERRRQCAALTRLDAVMEVGATAPSARAASIVLDLSAAPVSPPDRAW
ncbi:MAG: lipid-A-disaccharide synthase [Xanthobacteraceae bacterium]|nr:lipid-A-disaccharide synthase [Xanthobacteraceae bacterium]